MRSNIKIISPDLCSALAILQQAEAYLLRFDSMGGLRVKSSGFV